MFPACSLFLLVCIGLQSTCYRMLKLDIEHFRFVNAGGKRTNVQYFFMQYYSTGSDGFRLTSIRTGLRAYLGGIFVLSNFKYFSFSIIVQLYSTFI